MDRARNLISQQAHLEWQLVLPITQLDNALGRIDRAVLDAGVVTEDEEEETPDTANRSSQAVRDAFFRSGRDTTQADSAAAQDTAQAPPSRRPLTELLEPISDTEFRVAEADVDRARRYLSVPGVREMLPRGTELVWGAEPAPTGAQLYRSLYLLEAEPFIEGDQLENAVASRDPQFGETVVQFDLDRRGGRTFENVTGRHVGDRIAIVLDGVVHSAPVVNQRIGASGVIQMGQAPMEEARDLALVLRAGAFTAPVGIMEIRQIGPSLGQDSIDQGQIASIIGIAMVVLIMVGYYRVAGALAIGGLAVYILILMGGLAALGAALTAPGIAGLILSIGMAVDANVLIFERIREELDMGRTPRAAVENGFQHAMSAIVDSNLTTVITGLILYRIGTGPVQGFAVTLTIGILASFFSAVFVTKTLFMLYLERRRSADPISI
jgi:preprotein translocase subunit SecD